MTAKEIWEWVDALSAMKLSEEQRRHTDSFFSIWDQDLYGELFQGRGVIANVSFDGGLLLSEENPNTLVYGCTFKNIVSAFPLQLA